MKLRERTLASGEQVTDCVIEPPKIGKQRRQEQRTFHPGRLRRALAGRTDRPEAQHPAELRGQPEALARGPGRRPAGPAHAAPAPGGRQRAPGARPAHGRAQGSAPVPAVRGATRQGPGDHAPGGGRRTSDRAPARSAVTGRPGQAPARDEAPPRVMGHWSPDQLAAFPEATENHSLASAFHLSASGLRRGEVVALRWEDVDLDAGELTITRNAVTIRGQVKEGSPKSLAGNRTVILGDDTLAALKRARRARIGFGPRLHRRGGASPAPGPLLRRLPAGGAGGRSPGDPAPRRAAHGDHQAPGQGRPGGRRHGPGRPLQPGHDGPLDPPGGDRGQPGAGAQGARGVARGDRRGMKGL